MRKLQTLAVTALAGLALIVAAGVSPTRAADDYFKGKVIQLILPNSPSGNMARYANLFAPYIAKYAGADEVRVVNMRGGGGVKGTNFLWFQKPDGLTIAFTSVPALILAQLSGSEAVQFDTTKFVYLGRAATEPRGLVVGTKSGIESVDDLKALDREFVYPTQGTDEDFYTMAILSDALGFKEKPVTGYEGQTDTTLAVIKGDGDGLIQATRTSIPMMESGDMRLVLSIWNERDPRYPDVPSALEVVEGPQKNAVQAIVNMLAMHRGFFAPPGLDADATRILRDAITKAAADPELVKGAEEQGLILLPSPGAEEQKKIEQITTASEAIVPVLKQALESIQ
jgi:tripartite-type tricarboxylate transporter receptor subunit TctC